MYRIEDCISGAGYDVSGAATDSAALDALLNEVATLRMSFGPPAVWTRALWKVDAGGTWSKVAQATVWRHAERPTLYWVSRRFSAATGLRSTHAALASV